MKTPRRRVLRPVASAAAQIQRGNLTALRRYEVKLATEQTALRRWMKRLKRSFTVVAKTQSRILRIEKQLALLRQV